MNVTVPSAARRILCGLVETDVLGCKAWHYKCLTCGQQGARQDKMPRAIAQAKAHRCTRWGSTV